MPPAAVPAAAEDTSDTKGGCAPAGAVPPAAVQQYGGEREEPHNGERGRCAGGSRGASDGRESRGSSDINLEAGGCSHGLGGLQEGIPM